MSIDRFDVDDARRWMRAPTAADDKYARGVVGLVTGSERYPGAAVLGVEAAHRAGAGMVRYVGPRRASDLVLARRPETVTGVGRVQAWVLGSGMDPAARSSELRGVLGAAIAEGMPTVLDAGALDLARNPPGPLLVTPHAGELVGILAARGIEATRAEIAADPSSWALRASALLRVTVLLKGATTVVAHDDRAVQVVAPTHWLSTAGTGDVLAGIAGALLAAHATRLAEDPRAMVEVAAAAAWVHGEAAVLASAGGPLVGLDVAVAASRVVAELLR